MRTKRTEDGSHDRATHSSGIGEATPKRYYPKGTKHLSRRRPNEVRIEDGVAYVQICRRNLPNTVMLIDADDWDYLQSAASTGNVHMACGGYASVHLPACGYQKVHRVITGCPSDKMVDHINHNRLDNRRSNLRITDNAGNTLNKAGARRGSTTGYRGVTIDPKKKTRRFRACLWIKGKSIWLGRHLTAEAAARAVQEYLAANHPFLPSPPTSLPPSADSAAS